MKQTVYMYFKQFVQDRKGTWSAEPVKSIADADVVSISVLGTPSDELRSKIEKHILSQRSDFVLRSEVKGKVNREDGTYLSYGLPSLATVVEFDVD